MYNYGHQEQVTVRNHNRRTTLEWSVLKYWEGRGWEGGVGGGVGAA